MKKYIQFAPEDDTKVLKVTIDYELGGINYFSGSTSRRGIYIYFRSVEIKKWDGYNMESYVMFGEKKDRKLLLKETARDNKKLTEKIVTEFLRYSDDDILEYYNNPENENEFKKFLSINF